MCVKISENPFLRHRRSWVFLRINRAAVAAATQNMPQTLVLHHERNNAERSVCNFSCNSHFGIQGGIRKIRSTGGRGRLCLLSYEDTT